MTTNQHLTKKIGINGFGRIGRNVIRAYFESKQNLDFDIVQINDIADIHTLAHLLKYDTTHGIFFADVCIADDNQLMITHQQKQLTLTVTQNPSPNTINWQKNNIDTVLECTGLFRSRALASQHLNTAKRVIIGAAPFDSVDIAVVYGVNHQKINKNHQLISSVSCTTQALVPLIKILDESVGIDSALMTEIHAVTTDQAVLDHAHRDLRRARASGHNFIPTTSSAIGALKQVLPNMSDKIDGYSVRVPTVNVAAIDLSFVAKTDITVNQLNNILINAANGDYKAIMQVTDKPLVSSDFNHSPYSLIADLSQTMCIGRHAKVYAWYDNEWGYANRLLDLCQSLPMIN